MTRSRGGSLARLALLGAGSLIIYVLAYLRPWPILDLWYRPKHNLGSITIGVEMANFSYFLAMVSLFLFFFLALRETLRAGGPGAWGIVIAGMAGFNAVALLTHPFISNDVFDYIIRGRILSMYGGNPFYETPNDYMQDLFYSYSWWRDVPSAYGPFWELLAAGVTRLAGDNVLANVIGFKAVAMAGHLGTVLLVARLLRHVAPSRALFGVTFLGWNPLLIVETAGNAHNDMLMAFFMVLALFLTNRGRLTLAVIALAAGTLVKFIPALLVPVVLVEAMKRLESWNARLRFLAVSGAAGAAMTVAAYAPFWEGGDIIGLGRRSQMFSTSVSTLVVGTLEQVIDYEVAARLVAGAAFVALLVWMGIQLRHQRRETDPLAPARAALSILLFYLLISVPWFFQWYLAWPLALAALLPPGAALWGTLLYALTSSWKPATFYLFFRVLDAPLHQIYVWEEWPLTFLVIVPPLAYFIHAWSKRRAGGRGTQQPLEPYFTLLTGTQPGTPSTRIR